MIFRNDQIDFINSEHLKWLKINDIKYTVVEQSFCGITGQPQPWLIKINDQQALTAFLLRWA